jgi:hypothetical protein
MREMSPAENLSVDEFLAIASPWARDFASALRRQKETGTRPRPSSTLIDRSRLLTPARRRVLLDEVALLVDERLFGRSEMCIQFADLLSQALRKLGFPARGVLGTAIYYSGGQEVFRWRHAWVRIDREVVDGNVDVLSENPVVPDAVSIAPYWGPISETPPDRRLKEELSLRLPFDSDVANVWWPELSRWVGETFMDSAP